MSKKRERHSRKVPLPTDRTGAPIHVGDVLEWANGERMKVFSLTYYGDQFDVLGYRWTADGEGDGEYSDNLAASLIVWRGVCK